MDRTNGWIGAALAAVGLLGAPLVALETWVRTKLFDHALYTNSDALDRTLDDFARRDDWRILIVGDSEVRWGVDPRPIEVAFAQSGVVAPTFNFGIDGFSGGWAPRVVEELRLIERAPQTRVVVMGVQLVEIPEIVTHDNVCNAARGDGQGFQETVFSSSFARDWGIAAACADSSINTRAVLLAERALATVRYREPLRAALLGAKPHYFGLSDSALPVSFNGFQPHVPRSRNGSYQVDLDRVLEERAKGGEAYRPLAPNAWDGALADGGVFEVARRWFAERNVLLVLTPLPTNPQVVTLKDRRADYERHRARLAAFAQRPGVAYVDMPLRDDLDAEVHFTDHRHLSGAGAAVYSADLAAGLAANARVQAALAK